MHSDHRMTNPPETIGRYEVIGQLATGGMAEILLARLVGPSGFERPVVIKRILAHLVNAPGMRDMFIDEARILAGLRHANIVNVYAAGERDGLLYFVMEYVEGETLRDLLEREKRLSPARTATILCDIAQALSMTVGGIVAHQSALKDGELLKIPQYRV